MGLDTSRRAEGSARAAPSHIAVARDATAPVAAPPVARSSREWRIAVALGFMIGFTGMAHRTGFGVVYPAMVTDQGWTASEITGAFSVAMLIYSPAALLTGYLLDTLGVRFTILLGSVVLSAGLGLIGLTTEIWQIYLLYGIGVGVGGSAVGYIAMLKMLALRAGPRLGWAIGVFNIGQGFGSLVGAPLLQFSIDHASWRAGFFLLGGAAFLALFPLALLGAPDRTESRGGGGVGRAPDVRRLVRLRPFWLVLLANGAIGYLMLLPAHQVAHLLRTGVPDLMAAAVGGLFGGFIGLGALAGGWAIDRRRTGRLGVFGCVLLLAGILALMGSGPAAVGLAAVYALVGGLGRGMIGVNMAAFQARTFAGPSLGRVAGLLDLGFGFGAFAGPYLVALSRDQLGSYVPGLATALIAATVAGVCPLIAGRTAKR